MNYAVCYEPFPRSWQAGLRSWGDWRDIENNVWAIRRAIATTGRFIEFHCYNQTEADETREKLTPDERARVRFFWLRFDKRNANGKEKKREKA